MWCFGFRIQISFHTHILGWNKYNLEIESEFGLNIVKYEMLNLYMLNFTEGTKTYFLHFMSFLHIDMTQVVEILSQVRQGPTYSR